MSRPAEVPEVVRLLDAVTGTLLAKAESLAEPDVRAPSALSDWTRAHVLAHLINQGDAFRRMMWGAAHGLSLHQYPGGSDQRNAEVDRNARWAADQLGQELRRSCDELRNAVTAMPDEGWSQTIIRSNGPQLAWQGVRGRVLEVAFHTIDLDVGYTASDWPAGFVDCVLPDIAAQYERRTAGRLDGSWRVERSDGTGSWTLGTGSQQGTIKGMGSAILAWLMGRGATADLTFDGDATTAAAIPTCFPYGSQYSP